jgi:hypothetical protein
MVSRRRMTLRLMTIRPKTATIRMRNTNTRGKAFQKWREKDTTLKFQFNTGYKYLRKIQFIIYDTSSNHSKKIIPT